MNISPRKLFVIVGYPHTGKKVTLQTLFRRKGFFPFKRPIKAAQFGNKGFIVINISDHNHRTEDYLARIKAVMASHTETPASFMVIISLVLDGSIRDVKPVLQYFNQSGFDVHYLVLCSSMYEKKVISEANIELFRQHVSKGQIHLFDKLVTQSTLRFRERVEEVTKVIDVLLATR
ncbi:hypothetical protein CLV51_101623 [Chitinophaga niastensis]|uniref:AAA domain-containing protein n=1 Tax=Chitinophaga niastensis TaxID=536980 RepID=A0A2P8HSW7_CHINA|nr:hypothetical protein [Chitinophaga niastensis]PSL49292.1 hypothetical protein CLV51_101623 [Chitinophaga niastensis]